MPAPTLRQQIEALRTTPNLPGAQDVEAMANRVRVLERLYKAEGRDNPAHSHHRLYTGLWEAWQQSAPF